jgi:hypothetical protein
MADPTTKRPGGRPTKATPAVTARVCELLSAGCPQDTAARAAGISPSTYHAWIRRGEAERERIADGLDPDPDETLFRDFRDATQVARAEAEAEAVGVIRAAFLSGTWQAAAWWLERTRPDLWGRSRQTADPDVKPPPDPITSLLQTLGGPGNW